MGLAIDTVVASAVNPGAGPAAAAAAPGDSLVVRNARDTAQVYLEGIWRVGAAAGFVRVRSPLLHDFTQGLRYRSQAAAADRLSPFNLAQPLEPQDALTVELSGGAAETDSAALQLWYSDLPGASAILKMPGDIMGSVDQFVGQEVATVSGAAAGQWGDTAINATFDNFKANRWYALLGYSVDAGLTSLALKGPDTGNFRVGGPAPTTAISTRDYFIRVSEETGRPHIPVFNSANKSATFISTNAIAGAGVANASLTLALLSANWTP